MFKEKNMSFALIPFVGGIYHLEMKLFGCQKASVTYYCSSSHLSSAANFSHPLPCVSAQLEEAASTGLW